MTGEKQEKGRVLIGPEVRPGVRSAIHHIDGEVTVGEMCKMEDGRPLPQRGMLVHVGARESDGWHGTQVVYRSGPAQVATRAYCDGYDRIFGKKPAQA